jgi:hypothetical protein
MTSALKLIVSYPFYVLSFENHIPLGRTGVLNGIPVALNHEKFNRVSPNKASNPKQAPINQNARSENRYSTQKSVITSNFQMSSDTHMA